MENKDHTQWGYLSVEKWYETLSLQDSNTGQKHTKTAKVQYEKGKELKLGDWTSKKPAWSILELYYLCPIAMHCFHFSFHTL